jgi:hypothetical protein
MGDMRKRRYGPAAAFQVSHFLAAHIILVTGDYLNLDYQARKQRFELDADMNHKMFAQRQSLRKSDFYAEQEKVAAAATIQSRQGQERVNCILHEQFRAALAPIDPRKVVVLPRRMPAVEEQGAQSPKSSLSSASANSHACNSLYPDSTELDDPLTRSVQSLFHFNFARCIFDSEDGSKFHSSKVSYGHGQNVSSQMSHSAGPALLNIKSRVRWYAAEHDWIWNIAPTPQPLDVYRGAMRLLTASIDREVLDEDIDSMVLGTVGGDGDAINKLVADYLYVTAAPDAAFPAHAISKHSVAKQKGDTSAAAAAAAAAAQGAVQYGMAPLQRPKKKKKKRRAAWYDGMFGFM